MENIATFSGRSEFAKATQLLAALQLPYKIVSPDPAYSLVGVPAIICDSQGLSAILSERKILCAGWTRHRPLSKVPEQNPCHFGKDIFGRAAIMFLGPCMSDNSRIRLIAHLSGDLTPVLPYLNSTMPHAHFNAGSYTLNFMDAARMISLSPHKIAIAKADDIVDAWRTLEELRCMVNQLWERRSKIVASYESRSKPTAVDIYDRLPKMNCRTCGEQSCMAFAVRLWQRKAAPSKCTPIFTEEHAALREALLEICRRLSVRRGTSRAPRRRR